MKELREWALSHGFRVADASTLHADWRGDLIEIEFLDRNVRLNLRHDDRVTTLLSGHPGRFFLNESGHVEGMGLGASFLANFDPAADERRPEWIDPGHWDAHLRVREQLAGMRVRFR